MTPLLVLASGSPRRRDLLARAGVAFEPMPPEIAEHMRPGEAPAALVERLACEKASHVAATLGRSARRVVLGSDTVVVLDADILGKPRDAAEAVTMLTRLLGREHRVFTGVAVVESDTLREHVFSVESRVLMREAPPEEVRRYVATGEPMDKAGAYAFQGEGRRFVSEVIGSETNVIGLPMEPTLALLREVGVVADPAAATS